MLDCPIIEGAAECRRPIRVWKAGIAVKWRRPGEQSDINIPPVQMFCLEEFECEVEISRVTAGVFIYRLALGFHTSFQIDAVAPNGDVRIAAEMQTLVEQVLLIELR